MTRLGETRRAFIMNALSFLGGVCSVGGPLLVMKVTNRDNGKPQKFEVNFTARIGEINPIYNTITLKDIRIESIINTKGIPKYQKKESQDYAETASIIYRHAYFQVPDCMIEKLNKMPEVSNGQKEITLQFIVNRASRDITYSHWFDEQSRGY